MNKQIRSVILDDPPTLHSSKSLTNSALAAKLKSGNEEAKEDETMKLIRRMLAEMESFWLTKMIKLKRRQKEEAMDIEDTDRIITR